MAEFINKSLDTKTLIGESEAAMSFVANVLESAASHFSGDKFLLEQTDSVYRSHTLTINGQENHITFSANKYSDAHEYEDRDIECVAYKISHVQFFEVDGLPVAENIEYCIDDQFLQPSKAIYYEYYDEDGDICEEQIALDEEVVEQGEVLDALTGSEILQPLEEEMQRTFSRGDLQHILSILKTLGFNDFDAAV